MEFLETGAQLLEIFCFHGVNAGEDHRLYFFKARNGFLARTLYGGNRVAHLYFRGGLDAAHDVAHVAAAEHLTRREVHLEHAHLVGGIFFLRIDKQHVLALAD